MDFHSATPYKLCPSLSKISNLNVFVKLDNLQPSGSFKIRGIGNLCKKAVSRGDFVKFVSSSGGNAGLAAAYAAQQLGKEIIIYTPESTQQFVIDKLKSCGANVIVHGRDWDDANKQALIECKEPGRVYVPPFDHPDIWEGNSTIVSEIYNDVKQGKCEKPDVIVCSVGGGGLLCGVINGLKQHGWGDIPVVTVETEGAASFYKSVKQGERITLPTISSIAKSLGAKKVGETTFEMRKEHNIIPCVVTDKDAVKSILQFLDDERMLVEPSCSVCLCMVYNGTIQKMIDSNVLPPGTKNIAIVVCGGSGVKLETILKWKKDFNV